MEHIHTALQRYRFQTVNGRESKDNERPSPLGTSYSSEHVMYTHTRTIQIPMSLFQEHRLLPAFNGGPFVEAYKILRIQILHRLCENNWNVLAVTSPGASEGKTLTAVNLAISLGMDISQTALLVDADLRNPQVHKIFGVDAHLGLSDYLLNDMLLKSCLFHPDLGRLVVLPGGQTVDNSAEVLTSPAMIDLVTEMKHRYTSRTIVFDLPPVLGSADVLAFAPYVDAALVVIEESITSRESLDEALQQLKGVVPILGTVLNKSGRSLLSLSLGKKLRSSARLS